MQRVKNRLQEWVYGLMYRFFLWRRPDLRRADKIFTHLTPLEKRQLFSLASQIHGGYAIEIGSFVGASSCFVASGLMKGGGRLICIDTWENDAMSEGKRDTMLEFDQNTRPFATAITRVRGYSTDVVEEVRAITHEAALLFIDGDHSYEGVRGDWAAYKKFLKVGSIVVFHDIGWAEGVQRVVEEDVYPFVTVSGRLPNMWWGSLASIP